jgi:hypothetical protein
MQLVHGIFVAGRAQRPLAPVVPQVSGSQSIQLNQWVLRRRLDLASGTRGVLGKSKRGFNAHPPMPDAVC